MSEQSGTVEIGAYFYPLAECSQRQWRSRQLHKELGSVPARVPHELILAQEAQPLFDGHQQPVTYCLPEADGTVQTLWSDNDHDALLLQTILAQRHGLSYFIFDTYHGLRDGEPVEELGTTRSVLTRASTMSTDVYGMFGFKYARMETMQGPRALLPVPYKAEGILGQGFAGSLHEPGREYDVTPEAARHIVDCNVIDWQGPAYLKVQGLRPYLSILTPSFIGVESKDKQRMLGEFVRELYSYANERFGILPYLTGVLRHSDDVESWAESGVDAITTYSHLPEFSGGDSLQDYTSLMMRREQEWYRYQEFLNNNYGSVDFVPSVSVGWDASPRGEPGYTLEEVQGRHPYTPIVTNGSPSLFKQFLARAIDYTEAQVSDGRLVTIFAWNEVTEGAALLPRLLKNGGVDLSYLKSVSELVHQRARCTLCNRMPYHYTTGGQDADLL